MNLEIGTLRYLVRAQRPLPHRTYLCHLMRVIEARNIDIDSLTATPYTIRLILRHEFSSIHQWMEVAGELVNGWRPAKEEQVES